MAEEYCWAITQVAGRSCCGVLEFGLQLDSIVHTCIADRMYTGTGRNVTVA